MENHKNCFGQVQLFTQLYSKSLSTSQYQWYARRFVI